MAYDDIKPKQWCCKTCVMPELIRHDTGHNHLWRWFRAICDRHDKRLVMTHVWFYMKADDHRALHTRVEVSNRFLTDARRRGVTQAVQVCWHLPIHLRSQACLTFKPLTFYLLDFCPYAFRLMNAGFPPHRQLLVSVHFQTLWHSTSRDLPPEKGNPS